MSIFSWLISFLLAAAEGAAQARACLDDLEQHSLLQTTVKGRSDYGDGQLGDAGLVERSVRSFADTAAEVQAARSATNAAMGFESQAADLLKLGYKEVQQAEDIQEARVYQEANVTQILHDAVQQLQRQPQGRDNVALLEGLRQAEIAQSAMIKDATQEDQALAGLRSVMASAAQAATSAKLVDETRTARTLDNAMMKIENSIQLAKGIPQKLAVAASERAAASTNAYTKERSAASAEHEKAEVARREASAMYQAASTKEAAIEDQTKKAAEGLRKVSSEASQVARYLEGALRDPTYTSDALMANALR